MLDVNDPPTPPVLGRAVDESEIPSSVNPDHLRRGTSSTIVRPNKRCSAVGGRKAVKRSKRTAATQADTNSD
eukprot:2407530-Rhodomonas_salina.2